MPFLFADQAHTRFPHETIYQALRQPDHPLPRITPRRPLRNGRLVADAAAVTSAGQSAMELNTVLTEATAPGEGGRRTR